MAALMVILSAVCSVLTTVVPMDEQSAVSMGYLSADRSAAYWVMSSVVPWVPCSVAYSAGLMALSSAALMEHCSAVRLVYPMVDH